MSNKAASLGCDVTVPMYAERGEFEYDVDVDRQYKNEQSFCDGLVAGGILDSDDFME